MAKTRSAVTCGRRRGGREGQREGGDGGTNGKRERGRGKEREKRKKAEKMKERKIEGNKRKINKRQTSLKRGKGKDDHTFPQVTDVHFCR